MSVCDNDKKLPKYNRRRILAQALASLVIDFQYFSLGAAISYGPVEITGLTSGDDIIKANESELSWIASLCFIMQATGNLLGGPITTLIGRKKAMLIGNIPYVLAWILMWQSKSISVLLLGNALVGLGTGALSAPMTSYLGEIWWSGMTEKPSGVTFVWWWVSRADIWYLLYRCAEYVHRAHGPLSSTAILLDELLESDQSATPPSDSGPALVTNSRPDNEQQPTDEHSITDENSCSVIELHVPSPAPHCTCACGASFHRDSPKNLEGYILETTSPNWQSNKTSVSHRNEAMYLNTLMSDVTFLVDKEEIPAHKYVLSTSSAVFYRMFYGGLPENNTTVTIPDVKAPAFKEMLRYMYCDTIELNADTVLECMYVAEKYEVVSLVKICVQFLESNLSAKNACIVLMSSLRYREEDLCRQCWEIIDAQTQAALESEDVAHIDRSTLKLILEREKLTCKELTVFKACVTWAKAECQRQNLEATHSNKRLVLSDCINLIRFPCMTSQEMANEVVKEHLLTSDECLGVFLYFLAMDKPELSFNTKCRIGLVPKVCHRFRVCSHRNNQWRYRGKKDAIQFSVSRRVFVIGLGLYGSSMEAATYSARIELKTDFAHLAEDQHTYYSDGKTKIHRTDFARPIQIDPGRLYTVSALVEGAELSYFGQEGRSNVCVGETTFRFQCSSESTNGTGVQGGQIPQIIFYESSNLR